jgi:alpha-L-rhamnosidase
MQQKIADGKEGTVSGLSGPWWTTDTAFDPEAEYRPEEAFFRIEFGPAPEAKFRLATGGFYQFWLNGTWIGNGPARAPHGRLTVDDWDLPPLHLREQNVLCVQIFWEGIFTFDHVRGEPGLWYALTRGGADMPADFLVSAKTGRIARTKSSLQRGWIEEIDGRQRASGWPTGPWRSSDWQKPVLRAKGRPVALEARDIKPFVRKPLRAESVSFVGSGDLAKRTKHRGMYFAANNPDYADSPDAPATVMQEEALEPAQAADVNVAALAESGMGMAILGPDARGLDRTVQLNFGKLVTGTLSLTVEAPAGTVIDFGWSEGRWNDADMGLWARTAQPGGSAPSEELNDARQGMRYICAGGGVETFHALYLVSLHNLRIAFRSPEVKASLRVHDCTLISRGYPIAREGTFTCSDAGLNRIHETLLYTMSCSVDDVYMDCPGRERGGYPNDSYFASHGFLDVTGDFAFDRRFLRQFFSSQDEDPSHSGATAPVYPADSARWNGWRGARVYRITGHHLFWVIQCERHLRLYGDDALAEKWKPGLARGIAAINQYRSAEGLLEGVPWDTYVDWSRFESGPIQTCDNYLYAIMLKRLGEFFGNKEWLAQGHETAEAIERLAWNPDRELYADTVVRKDKSLTASSAFSAVTNYIALWSGLAKPEHAARAWRQVRDFRPLTVSRPLFDYETGFVRANLVGLMYRFGYQGRRGELHEMIRDIREAYEPMFARGQGTIGELLGYHGSLCHGYNAYVVHLLKRYIAGIELPEQPGGLIRIRPQPGLLAWCQARVCWMQGHVQVWWSRTGDELEVIASVPRGQEAELRVAGADPIRFTDTLHIKVKLGPG